MKNLITTSGLMVTICALILSAIPASAQSQPMRFDVPFQFLMGNEVMPAGQYTVSVGQWPRKLEFRAPSHSTALQVSIIPVYSNSISHGRGKLVFHKYGKTVVLKKVWSRGQTEGLEILPSRAEREMAKAYPATRSEVIVLGAD